MALLQFLLDSPGSRHELAQFIVDLPAAPNDALADLRAHFPETLGHAPRKWWTLSVAHLSATDRYETLSAADTAARLDRWLRFSITAPDGTSHDYSLGDYEAYRKLPVHRDVLRRASQQLLLLGARAHPSYRAIVQEDYELAELLARGKTRKMRERLERVASYREVIEHQARRDRRLPQLGISHAVKDDERRLLAIFRDGEGGRRSAAAPARSDLGLSRFDRDGDELSARPCGRFAAQWKTPASGLLARRGKAGDVYS